MTVQGIWIFLPPLTDGSRGAKSVVGDVLSADDMEARRND